MPQGATAPADASASADTTKPLDIPEGTPPLDGDLE
jgi:hypothetical protein